MRKRVKTDRKKLWGTAWHLTYANVGTDQQLQLFVSAEWTKCFCKSGLESERRWTFRIKFITDRHHEQQEVILKLGTRIVYKLCR